MLNKKGHMGVFMGLKKRSSSSGESNYFIMTIDTTKAGSASDTFVLPLHSGTQNFTIHWGDGSSDLILTHLSPNLTHQYSSGGVYQISIDGSFTGIDFNNGGDKLKVISLDNWGVNTWSQADVAFYGCENMVANYSDVPDWSQIINLTYVFRGCLLFDGGLNGTDVSNVTIFTGWLRDCQVFNQPLDQLITSSLTLFNSAMRNMFSFDQDISNFDFSNMTSGQSTFIGTTLSTANYDALLISIDSNPHQNNVPFHGGNSTYTLGSAAETARTNLVNDGWPITDGGGI